MAKIIINLPGGLQVEREVSDKPAPKSSSRPKPAFAPDPVPGGETPEDDSGEGC